MRRQRGFERVAGFFVVTLLRIEHGEVVVGLGQLRVVARQVGEHLDRLRAAVELDQDQAAQEAGFGVLRCGLELSVDLLQRLIELTLRQQRLRFLDGRCGERGLRGQPQQRCGGAAADIQIKAFIHPESLDVFSW